jgi:hypothetical protein
MDRNMPIRTYQPYEPGLLDAMRLAFHKACETLQITDNADPFKEIIAAKIVEQARTGESDPERLYNEALDELKRKAS